MAKKDTDNFDFEVEGEGKAKGGLNLDFIKNLTKQQKGIILAALVGIVLVVAIVVAVVAIGANIDSNSGTTGGENPGTGGSGDKEIIAAEKATEIYIFSQPTKLVYYVSEYADYSGMVVAVSTGLNTIYYKYDDYSDMFTITGFDSSEAVEEQTVTVTYGELSDTFNIAILAHSVSQASLVGITVDPLPKTTYKAGEPFDPTGGVVVCKYSDGTTKTVDLKNKHISGFGAIAYTPGDHEIKIKYSDSNGGYAETYITVTITE